MRTMHFVQEMRSWTGFELMSQFATYIHASESFKFVMFAGVLYTFGEDFCRYAWHF